MSIKIESPEVTQGSDMYAQKPNVNGAKVLVDGKVEEWLGKCVDVFSPIYLKETGEKVKIGSQAVLTEEASVAAVKAAAKAWGKGRGPWAKTTLQQRIAAVEKLVAKLKTIRTEIVNVLQWEICKNDADAAKEFDRTMDFIGALIAAALKGNGGGLQCEEGVHAVVKRSAIGVMLNLGPANYPFNETYATLIPALLMGNSVVMKIPNTGGLAHVLTMEAYAECFPAGVVNFVSGRGRDTMPPIMATGLVDVFAFIGSSKAADTLIRQHPAPHRLKSLLSLDAKNFAVVLPDADLEVATKEILLGSTSYNGQRCTAVKLVMVHSSIAEAFNEKFCKAVSGLAAGLPFGKNAITPLAASTPEYMDELVKDAQANGAKILNESGGHWDRSLFFPAVMYPVQSNMKLWREEQFGPVIPIATYTSVEEVYEYMAEMHFGQQAAIFTSQSTTKPSVELTDLLDACALSTCRVNLNVQCSRGPDCYPFAGRKSSALGTISVTEVLSAVSVETMVASKNEALISRSIIGSNVFGKGAEEKKSDTIESDDFALGA